MKHGKARNKRQSGGTGRSKKPPDSAWISGNLPTFDA